MNTFSHIYIEKEALSFPLTKEILERLSNITPIIISHYKNIFNRRNQDFLAQKKAPALILAVNNGTRIYPGARFCQSFGNEHFYYTSQIKNCLYDCEYCFLQGMYPSGHIVIFVNIEDYFNDIIELLKSHPVYVSISYDTDLLALEGLTGLVAKWCEFSKDKPRLLLELRTKCGSVAMLDKLSSNNLVISYTISPEEIAKKYEHGAATTSSRIKAFYKALELNLPARICLDPIIPVKGYKTMYTELIDDIFANPLAKKVSEVSIGSFRISKEYIKNLRSVRQTPITMYPYENIDGMMTFNQDKNDEIMKLIKERLTKYIPGNKIYAWDALEENQ